MEPTRRLQSEAVNASAPHYTIREARPADFEEIIRFWGTIDRHTALPDQPEYLETFHRFSPDLFLVAEAPSTGSAQAPGRIVGTVIGGWDGWRAQIARLATDPGLRRQGIAQTLVHEIESRLEARGARRIYALVDRRSAPAIPFWEAAGYSPNENIIQYSRNFGEGEGG